jgi:DNA-3-methyladenine glycosylase II
LAKALRRTATVHSVMNGQAEQFLSVRDAVIARLIEGQTERWSIEGNKNPIWGLIRIIVAQQISTKAARTITERIARLHPNLVLGSFHEVDPKSLRDCGLSPRKARCCTKIAGSARQIMHQISQGQDWEKVLEGIPGIGPWTISIFRIMILHDPDVFPEGDLGLVRAITTHYGSDIDVAQLSRAWTPFRSVACWYLWRSLAGC